jgi:hypothetical protein
MNEPHESLEHRLKAYYNHQKLSAETVKHMRQIVEESQERKPNNPSSFRPTSQWTGFRPAALGFALLICCIAIFWIAGEPDAPTQAQLIAAEIALNHRKPFEADYFSSDIADLNKDMTQLDFALVQPPRLKAYKFVGARYCTIGDAIAAQLLLTTEQDADAYTLYQFRSSTPLMLSEAVTLDVQDVRATLWSEGALILGLAQTITNPNSTQPPPTP